MRKFRYCAACWVLAFCLADQAESEAAAIWLSTTGAIGEGSSQPENVAAIPNVFHSLEDVSGSLFIWARPNAGITLQNWSLRLRTTDPSILDFTTSVVEALNPILDDSLPNVVRWEFVGEPTGQTVLSASSAVSGDLQGFSLFGGQRVGVGIGPNSADNQYNDPYYDSDNDAWLLAQVDYQLSGLEGTTEVYLQIGEAGINNAGQPSSQALIVFGAATDAVLSADTNRNLDSTTPDAMITVAELVPEGADFDDNGQVDGRDFLFWQQGYGLSGGAAHSDGDATGDASVDAADLAVWRNEFGTTLDLAQAAATKVPEPAGGRLVLFAVVTATLIQSWWNRLPTPFIQR